MAKLEYQEKDGKVFCPLVNKWLVAKPEEKVRQRYICTLSLIHIQVKFERLGRDRKKVSIVPVQ